MAELLGAATTATKLFLEVNQISIDNWTFKLFYKATTTLLLGCSVIAGSKQFFGDPINCEVTGGGVNEGVLQSYCWMYSKFELSPFFKGTCVRRDGPGGVLYNSYYQWVSIFLVVSAILFYLPRATWLMMEGGLMKFLSKGTTGKIVEDADEKRATLLKTFKEHLHNKYNAYACGFLVCEQLNLLVVSSQWFITHHFLKYQFLRYGSDVVSYYMSTPEDREQYPVNPMCETFPRIASCDYHRYGPGGAEESKNAICVLGLNMINDKIFLILWFWYLFLTIFGLTRLLYRIMQISSRRFRYYVMRVRIHRYFKSNKNLQYVKSYVTRCSYGDWFVLYQMSRNMNRRFFSDFLTVLSKEVDPGRDPELLGIFKSQMKFPFNLENRQKHELDSPKPDSSKTTSNDRRQSGLVRQENTVQSSVSLHNQAVDITFDTD